jgi:putative acetyltransferase
MADLNDQQEHPSARQKLDGFVIRAAAPADAEQLTALFNLPGVRNGTLRLPYQTIDETRKRLESLGPGAKEIVADHNGQIIGSIFLGPMLGRRRHVATLGMGVHDDFTGQGVGSVLMKAALDVADNWLGLRRVELTVFVDNAAAIRLYERSGFVTEGQFKDYAFRDGRYVDAYAMARVRG